MFALLPTIPASLLQKEPMPPPSGGFVYASEYNSLQAAADYAFGKVESPHGITDVTNNKTLVIDEPRRIWTPPSLGVPVLDLRHLCSGRIIGTGRLSTKLRQNVAGVPVVRTNGCGYSHFEGFECEGSPESVVFDLNWDGTAGGAALQSNTFVDLLFLNGNYGTNIGAGGFMGSENTFINCYWQSNVRAALVCSNYNALQQQIFGGNVQNCGIGFWATVGSIPIIHGVGFQLSKECDIRTDGNPANTMSIVGCRTESKTFILNHGGHRLDVSACTQTYPGKETGYLLYQSGGQAVVRVCKSNNGSVLAKFWANIRVENSEFNREDWLEAHQPWWIPNNNVAAVVEAHNVFAGKTHILARRYQALPNGTDFPTLGKISDYAMVQL
jgi:hypothetical protein